MSESRVKLVNLCSVFISEDVERTVKYYVEKLGFKYACHYDKDTAFATIYRDSIELVIVQSKYGKVESNIKRYGVGYDAYIDPDTVGGVDLIYEEYLSKNIKIISRPHLTDYGSYEFVIEDIDGRHIGIGRIDNKNKFFKKSNLIE
ncbi:VOC family protein [Clostridiaceae bacterium M8S5]|nr:VOC family protein [Clostridiaceae bacterium M8S5]